MASALPFGSAPAAAVESVRSVKPIVVLDNPIDTLAYFFAAVEAGADDSHTFFQRAFGAAKAAQVPKHTVVSDQPASRSRLIMVADADPNFERWQKDANERLKLENDQSFVKQHPFALANPGKSVIVCEAGCRTTKDEIVYIAAVVAAVLPASTPSGERDADSSDIDPDPAAQGLEEGEAPCIAGCYDRPQRKASGQRRAAERRELPALRPNIAPSITLAQAYATDRSTAAKSPIRSHEPIFASVTPLEIADRIRARIQLGHNGAIVEQRRNDETRFADGTRVPSTVAPTEIYRTWRTKIVFVRPQGVDRSPANRARFQSRREHHASAQTQFARRYSFWPTEVIRIEKSVALERQF